MVSPYLLRPLRSVEEVLCSSGEPDAEDDRAFAGEPGPRLIWTNAAGRGRRGQDADET